VLIISGEAIHTNFIVFGLTRPEFKLAIYHTRGTTLSDKVCQSLASGLCFFPSTPVSSTNETDRHNITEVKGIVESGVKHHNPNSLRKIYVFAISTQT
jgi:hypothetical protein